MASVKGNDPTYFRSVAKGSALTLLSLPTNAWCSRSIGGWLLVWRDLCFLWNWTERHILLCDCAILFSFVSKLQIFKTLDETANPYLALAHVPMAGLCGMITESKELSMKDCSGEASTALLGEDGRIKLGIIRMLSAELGRCLLWIFLTRVQEEIFN